MKLKVIQDTVFKQTIEDSAKLSEKDKVSVKAGAEFEIHAWKSINAKHLRVALVKDSLGTPPRSTWHVFRDHVQLINSAGQPVILKPDVLPKSSSLPEAKLLNVPYKSQLDNALNPTGACNVTCFAMGMAYFKIKGRGQAAQFEDELYRYMETNRLSRHDPLDLAKMASVYGLKSDFTTQGTLADMRQAIAAGKPCIIHGYFTSFGHIIVVRGYDKYGFFVNDPYGEWTSSGYLNSASGENLHYSNGLIQSKCSPEGDDFLWLHRLSTV
jgi:uncharacterized protein YvpB